MADDEGTEAPDEPARRRWPWLLALLLVLGAVAVWQSYDPEEPRQMDAYRVCREWVADELRSPASADFPEWGADVRVTGGGPYVVASHVDSENGFGATIRSHWRCQVEEVGGQWRLRNIEVIDR